MLEAVRLAIRKKAARCAGETLANLKVLLGIGRWFGCELDVDTSSVMPRSLY
jgi:hypothetical protein